MNNYKSFSELKEELGNNYDFKLYEMGISALKEIENLQEEIERLNNIINEIYTKALDTSITSLDLRDYIINNLGSDKE